VDRLARDAASRDRSPPDLIGQQTFSARSWTTIAFLISESWTPGDAGPMIIALIAGNPCTYHLREDF
jgi:hypothetical protein